MGKEILTAEEWHKLEAVNNFNGTWDLIEKENRTHEDKFNMIHKAHASRYHWGQIGTPLELIRGEWQLSRVYSLLSISECALLHGEESLRLCEENGIGDFDLAFAYEAIARAYSILRDSDHVKLYSDKAKSSALKIKKPEDREYLLSELESIADIL